MFLHARYINLFTVQCSLSLYRASLLYKMVLHTDHYSSKNGPTHGPFHQKDLVLHSRVVEIPCNLYATWQTSSSDCICTWGQRGLWVIVPGRHEGILRVCAIFYVSHVIPWVPSEHAGNSTTKHISLHNKMHN